jgi:formylglycine-generating enzyme required for sulfatase activity
LLFALLLFGCSDAPEEQPKPEDGSPSSEAGLSKGSALVLTLAGKVTVVSPSDAKENAAYVNQFLSPGDSLSTDPDSEALLLLTNGTTLSVGANTTFELKAFYQADFKGGDAKVGSLEDEASDSTILLDLKVGDLVVDVRKLKKKSNFEITTPLGVAGIRGTSFRLSASADSTKLSVLTGLVGFVSNDKKENQVGAEKVLVSSREKEPVINDLTDAQKQSIAQTVARAKKEADEISLSTLRDKLGKSFKTHLVPSAGNLEMIWVEPGKFTMGSPTNETGRETNEAELNVTLTKGFYLGKYEVTQAQWNAVKNTAPSHFSGNVRPVEQVSWTDATAFCATLTQLEQNAGRLPSGWAYVLPTEAQWEYACRAGTTTAYSWGNSIANSNANYNSNIGQTRDVGQYAANPWGFFDMHGNVWEWVNDRYQNAYPGETVTDPTGFASGSTRILRGGDWGNAGTTLRSARRTYLSPPSHRRSTLGFRLSLRPARQ